MTADAPWLRQDPRGQQSFQLHVGRRGRTLVHFEQLRLIDQ